MSTERNQEGREREHLKDHILISVKGKRYVKAPSGKFNYGKHSPIDLSEFQEGALGVSRKPYYIFQPLLEDIIVNGFKRASQIIYPKDSFYASLRIGVGPGKRILEVGTGSGAVTAVLSYLVGENGLVVTCDRREDMLKLAEKNLRKFKFPDNVQFIKADLSEDRLDFPDEYFNAAFVDVKFPAEVLSEVYRLLKPSGGVAFLLPTVNQVSELLRTLIGDDDRWNPEGDSGIASGDRWGDIEVIEILHRKYKPVPDRLRPDDYMIAHTGYLVFARKLIEGG